MNVTGNHTDNRAEAVPSHTPGEWSWWTSCSWRRLRSDLGRGKTADVLMPTVARDGQPDILASDEDMAVIAAAKVLYQALEPFADIDGEGDEDFSDDEPVVVKFGRTSSYTLKLGHLRQARAAIAKAEGRS